MRPETKKVARIVLDVGFLLNVVQARDGKGPFSCAFVENLLHSALTQLSHKKIPPDEVEFVLLTQSEHDPKGQFQKKVSDTLSEFIDYDALRDYLKDSEYAQLFLKENARQIPCISPAEKVFDRLMERIQVAASENSEALKELLKEFSSFLDATVSQEELRTTLNEPYAIFCQYLSADPKEIPLDDLIRVLNAFRTASSATRLLLNPVELEFLDPPGAEKISSLLILSGQTKVVQFWPHHFYDLQFKLDGNLDEESVRELHKILEYPNYQEVRIYGDFDDSFCHTASIFLKNDINFAVNSEIVELIQKIQASGNNTTIKLVTSRRPLHLAMKKHLEEVSVLMNTLKEKNLLTKDIQSEIQSALFQINEIRNQDLAIRDEIMQLKKIFLGLNIIENLNAFIDQDIFNQLPKADKKSLTKLINTEKDHYFSVKTTVQLLCVVEVCKSYEEKHNIKIEIPKDSHLNQHENRSNFKVNYIYEDVQNEKEKKLAVFLDDSQKEVSQFLSRTKPSSRDNRKKLTKSVDAVCIKISREMEYPQNASATFDAFLREAARTKRQAMQAEREAAKPSLDHSPSSPRFFSASETKDKEEISQADSSSPEPELL